MKLKFWNPIVRRKAHKKPKPSRIKARHMLHGGPLDGHKVCLCTSGTIPFSMGEYRGYYDMSNQWCGL
ncbi:MAG: hypothetical protein Tp138OMZ00d2C19078221_12 [Prokaryotic dsDNA virus sp.]|jgi:hypothetical protein|nr:hypothetical protein [Pseudomonadales bacterium]QDP67440.1 MAG: hypothetical protein Tp138OMZ00d2C19078221_12 [Prokaryotic dsDNA virus sp.]|tara:strand:+ start:38234 stop:38437 length:204 start_codon:yes stop_codon:yes gene_type:complete